MGKLARLPAKKVIQKLKKAGFTETHQRGSHLYLKSEDGEKVVTVPIHSSKEIPVGTLYNIAELGPSLRNKEFIDTIYLCYVKTRLLLSSITISIIAV